jgi:hypothetical protein
MQKYNACETKNENDVSAIYGANKIIQTLAASSVQIMGNIQMEDASKENDCV